MSKHFEYKPKGVCSRNLIFEMEGDIVESMRVEGGCSGNLQGIAALIKGKSKDEVIELLDGIKCGFKPTSCPDQIAQALKSYEG